MADNQNTLEKKPRRKKFGPPPGRRMGMMPQDMSEESIAIMPDFVRSREIFFQLDCVLVFVNFLFELLFFAFYHFGGVLNSTPEHYMMSQVVIPSGLNLIVLTLLIIGRHHLPKENSDMRQNLLPVFGMLLITMNISIVHCDTFATLCIYCIPIFMTTNFSHKMFCKLISFLSMVGATITCVRHFFLVEDNQQLVQALIESVCGFAILLLSIRVAMALLGMTGEQKQKLLNFAKNVKEEQHRAEAANIAKSAFLANMSHEIRTPINAILGMDEMIIRESKDNQITEYAENIYSASNSLLYLINDVLDISKIESGKLEIMENTYDTSSLVHDCCNMINERIRKKDLEFHVYCNPNLPSQLKGDEIRLRQILINLLSNAAKYTAQGSVTFSVDRQLIDGKFHFMASVKDTGSGIKEENLGKLFDQFIRLDLEKNRNIEGTGLGLSITKQLVDLMGGKIEVQSTYGVGSVFTVTVPQEVVDDTPIGSFQDHYKEVIKKNTDYKQGNFEAPEALILVVDDVDVNLKVAANLLKRTKIVVDTAKSGKECLEKVTKNVYDIIFMDHMMPEMSGIETFEKMKTMEDSLNGRTPVIMLTANAVTGSRDEYLGLGFADYLTKPILGDKLEKMILAYLPPEKIQHCEAGADDGSSDSAAGQPAQNTSAPVVQNSLMLLQNFYQSYPKVDIVHGLAHYGQNTNIYISVMYSFCNKIQPKPIKEAFEQKDTEKYEILLHDIKRAAADTGFYYLSNQAGLLEEAAGNKDWEYVSAHHDSFLIECQNITSSVYSCLNRRKDLT